MAHFLFVDESGHDRRHPRYMVLAGLAVADANLWNLVRALRDAEQRLLGVRYEDCGKEKKGANFLNAKTFRQAAWFPPCDEEPRRALASSALKQGALASREAICRLQQAKLAYVAEALELCARYRCAAFASMIDPAAPIPEPGVLRKDYAYLFERFYYFLEDHGPNECGLVVFDELERSQSLKLVQEMDVYFRKTSRGRQRSARILPEPLFVHSDLTTGIQLADLVAYIISWGFRLPRMTLPCRPELAPYAELVSDLRYRAVREKMGKSDFGIWSFALIDDLRTRDQRELAQWEEMQDAEEGPEK